MIVMIAFVAMAVDTGYLYTARNELQRSADAADELADRLRSKVGMDTIDWIWDEFMRFSRVKSYERYEQLRERLTQTTFESIDREIGVVGDPQYCVERIQTLRQQFPMEEFICYFNQGGMMDHAMVRQSMTLFAKEVMPHCR
jgi:alkanesulfonate monooxygenase SsuD/methylene tetrahydromethanopterin reductase-like flavin-dependent oxidoreductase (luciferase family)